MKRGWSWALLLLTAVLLGGCGNKLDREGMDALQRVGMAPIVAKEQVDIRENKNPAGDLIEALIQKLDRKFKGDTASAVIAGDWNQLQSEVTTIASAQFIPLAQYAEMEEYAKALQKASGGNVDKLEAVVAQEDLDGLLWVKRSYSIFVLPELTRWSRYWWYGMIETEVRLLDTEGHLILKAQWVNHSTALQFNVRPSAEQAVTALAEAHSAANKDLIALLMATSSGDDIPTLGNPSPRIEHKWLFDVAIFVRGAVLVYGVIFALGMFNSVMDRDVPPVFLIVVLVLVGIAVYLVIWHEWWRDVWKYLSVLAEFSG